MDLLKSLLNIKTPSIESLLGVPDKLGQLLGIKQNTSPASSQRQISPVQTSTPSMTNLGTSGSMGNALIKGASKIKPYVVPGGLGPKTINVLGKEVPTEQFASTPAGQVLGNTMLSTGAIKSAKVLKGLSIDSRAEIAGFIDKLAANKPLNHLDSLDLIKIMQRHAIPETLGNKAVANRLENVLNEVPMLKSKALKKTTK